MQESEPLKLVSPDAFKVASERLIVAISSRALFDLRDSHALYEREGLDSLRHQLAREDEILAPGIAFPLVEFNLNAVASSRATNLVPRQKLFCCHAILVTPGFAFSIQSNTTVWRYRSRRLQWRISVSISTALRCGPVSFGQCR